MLSYILFKYFFLSWKTDVSQECSVSYYGNRTIPYWCDSIFCPVLHPAVLCGTVLLCILHYCTVLCYAVLYCTVLYFAMLYCTVLCYAVLYCTLLCGTVLYFAMRYCTVLCYAVLYCTLLCGTVLLCILLLRNTSEVHWKLHIKSLIVFSEIGYRFFI